jgi:hypothetical protein
MSIENSAETLFDPDQYGPGKQRNARARSSVSAIEIPVEPLAPGWRWVRNREGVLPYAHLIKANNDYQSVLTMCNRFGTLLSNEGITQMTRCPLCDMERQLA